MEVEYAANPPLAMQNGCFLSKKQKIKIESTAVEMFWKEKKHYYLCIYCQYMS